MSRWNGRMLAAVAACLFGWDFAGAGETRAVADRPLDELLQIIERPNHPSERVLAVEAVARHGEAAVPGLRRLLTSRDSVIRSYALVGLTRLGPQAEQAVPDLVAALQQREDPLCALVATTLGRIGPVAAAAVPALREVAVRGSADARRGALRSLIAIGDTAALVALKDCLEGPDGQLQAATIDALLEADAVPPQLFPALTARVLSGDNPLSRAAWSVLARYGSQATSQILPLLKSDQADVRRRAAAVVFRLGRDGQKAAPLLVELLRDEDPNVRFWAAKALGEIGPAAQPARGPLRDCFGDPDADVRWQAIVSLRHIDGNSPEFLAALAALRQDPHPTVRKLVEEILSPTAPKPPAPRPN